MDNYLIVAAELRFVYLSAQVGFSEITAIFPDTCLIYEMMGQNVKSRGNLGVSEFAFIMLALLRLRLAKTLLILLIETQQFELSW